MPTPCSVDEGSNEVHVGRGEGPNIASGGGNTSMLTLVVYNPRLERDMITWIKVSGWKEGESGGRRGEGEVIGELGREKKKKISV